jgi:Trk K+ transport system NAD-binding subunit
LYGGLSSPNCAGIVAITNDNLVNLHVAITAKLLNPNLTVICRVDAHEVAANMASFKTDYLINPFDVFAIQLHKALHTPNLHVLREWLTDRRDNIAFNVLKPPRQGVWVLCGYGRFGKAVYEQLKEERNIHLVVVESLPKNTGYPACECVIGHGTEAHTLQQAHIEEATGIVAGTDDDVKNLSIVMTARELNPDLFVVIRQNSAHNHIIFEALHADVIMQPSQIVADHIRILLTTPSLVDFINSARQQDDVWTCELIERLNETLQGKRPNVWETKLTQIEAPAVYEMLVQQQSITVGHLLCDPRDRNQKLSCVPLLLVRGEQKKVLPEENEPLAINDTLLWCGTHRNEKWTQSWMEWTLRDTFVLTYLLTGQVIPHSYVWQWWERRKKRRQQQA